MSLAAAVASKHRKPTLECYIGFANLGEPVQLRPVQVDGKQGAFSHQQSYGQPIAGCTIRVVHPPAVPRLKDPIVINAGYNGFATPVMTGFITSVERLSYPRNTYNLTVQDLGWLAEFHRDAGESVLNLGNNLTANFAIEQLAQKAGIPLERVLVPPLLIDGSLSWTLGTKAPVIFRNTSPLQAMQRIVEVLGYWLFADAAGFLRASKIIGVPTDSVVATYTDGVDFLLPAPPRTSGDISQIHNAVEVSGGPFGVQGATLVDRWQVDHPLLPVGTYNPLSYSNALIEFISISEGGEASCEAVAKRLLAYHSRTPRVVTVPLKDDPRRVVGETVALNHERQDIAGTNFFIHSITRQRGGAKADMTLTLDGGVGPDGYTTVQPPLAAFTYHLVAETLADGDKIEVFLDGSASKSLGGGEIVEWTWTDGTTTHGPNPHHRSVFIYDAATTSVAITLTVRDTNSKTAAVTITIPLTGGLTEPTQRVLFWAVGNAWDVTPNGGKLWNRVSGEATIAVPPIAATGSVLADQEAAKTIGLLATGGV